jgi:hypothetical protein
MAQRCGGVSSAAFAVLLVTSCSGDRGCSGEPPPTPPAARPRTAVAPSGGTNPNTCEGLRERLAIPATDGEACDKAACEAAGGECGGGGFSCPKVCIRRARDAGARCEDEGECESTCVAPDGTRPGQPTVGKCYHLALNKACLNIVRRGVAVGVVCVD